MSETISDEDFTNLLLSVANVTESREANTCMEIIGKVGERYDEQRDGMGFLAACLLCASLFESYTDAAGMDEETKREILRCVKGKET